MTNKASFNYFTYADDFEFQPDYYRFIITPD